ncbi:RNA polymerase sigma factor [Cnuibacter physcomitrellae]|uniref:RNA polymerase sigma factor n=1 Tax=Cnuibacter physcomitrellae TaxID=1619308 RepID=UPI002175DC80|nr:RNA polymerase sigma factor [Cnuibacter physcomitrellae]MCS5498598.1 RNA polymerase sigma factor [Cnuibacter physcomitrellae]
MTRHPLDDAPDALLVARAGDGDVSAFEVIVRRYSRRLRAYASRMMGSSLESDDAVQDALIAAWDRIDTLEDGTVLRSWLMRIVTTKCLDRIRRRKDHLVLEESWTVSAPSADLPERRAEAAAALGDLDAALGRLPDLQRQTWIMREWGGASYDEIGNALGIAPSTVRGLLARSRRTLMTDMEGWR